ncbi:hypothetical protein SR1949_37560 [Sphaerospermopsis reniformis]|uniref:Uncharacterized protein n=1 Tax=Sphaerospermopsis reniformis TaxID=531300 RepID=A0A480A5M5_9CYAN|nr:hypothetical protein [Sphaerospermopsis reniformis]GCL38638.1 hypothetical protein SR1949_37560 [Sphaerospermopsis reniformis]
MSEISNISTDEKLLPNQNDSATSHADIAVSSELTELSTDEWRDRIFLERQVEKAFYAAAKALKEIRDRRLYRSTHSTFENYCRSRFGFTNRHVNYLIAGSLVVENLMGTNNSQIKTQDQTRTNGSQIEIPEEKRTNGSQIEIPEGKRTNGSQILPTSERQVRPLVSLEPEEQRLAWQQAVEQAGGKIPSGRQVQDIVDKIRERTKVPNPYHVGEVCILLPKDNPELKGKSGCWGVITHVGDYSCTIETWDTEYTVKIEHLKSLELLDEECQFMQQLCLRLRRLHQIENRDSAVDWLCSGLGKQPKPYLSPLQSKLLNLVEQEYGLTLT